MSEEAKTLPDYSEFLADMEARKAALEQAIAGLRGYLSSLGQGLPDASAFVAPPPGDVPAPSASRVFAGGGASSAVHHDTFFRMTATAAVEKYLTMVKRPQTTTEICEALKRGGYLSQSQHFTTNIYTAMDRKKETFTRVGKSWGLANWYPGGRKTAKGKGESADDAT